jgi:tetratricopeptide (TPR) repeat protein
MGAVWLFDASATVPLLLTRAAVEAADGDTTGAIHTLGDALGAAERTAREVEAGEAEAGEAAATTAAEAEAEVWESLMEAYAELGRSVDTKACSDEAARRLGRGHCTAAYCVGRHLEARGDYEGAQEAYTQVGVLYLSVGSPTAETSADHASGQNQRS